MIKIKRVYENKEKNDGPWILVERLWPRGIKKEKIDIWMRDAAPSNELRMWFSHDPSKWDEFKIRYNEELRGNKTARELAEMGKKGNVTIVYATSDTKRNGAIVLKEFADKLST
ncbi:MAG: DUF488 family protein [Nitrososphaerota archaeon]|nr:DUF488 family protein [Nitrososphaerota archaeon]MDG6931256.1 DUF488 family protein [Nitrososphaerota archaeon]